MGILTENAIKAPRFGIVVLQPYYTIRYTESVAQNSTLQNKRHYLLADIALVGEAITLAMRTNYKNSNFDQ